jgi:hypothetical protein
LIIDAFLDGRVIHVRIVPEEDILPVHQEVITLVLVCDQARLHVWAFNLAFGPRQIEEAVLKVVNLMIL